MKLDRRSMIAGAAALAGMACVPLDRSWDGRLRAALRIIERALGGRLGVALHSPAYRASLAYRGDERFPMCSTFKTSLAALVLALDQDGMLDLSERVTWTADDLIFHTPFTGERVAQGATLRELAHAAQTVSDNLAANLLLDRVGGPAGLTAFWRRIGDETSRLDRMETAVNFVPEGDVRDTTTPAAMVRTLAKMLDTNSESPLAAPRQRELRQWMIESTTGLKRVRAGLPADWVAGDKTGNSGAHPRMGYLRGNIGFALDPSHAPTFFAVYHQSPVGAPVDGEKVDAAFVQVGKLLGDWARKHEASVTT
mgnify:CR=1 FL=1